MPTFCCTKDGHVGASTLFCAYLALLIERNDRKKSADRSTINGGGGVVGENAFFEQSQGVTPKICKSILVRLTTAIEFVHADVRRTLRSPAA